jgi:hypothetical protein
MCEQCASICLSVSDPPALLSPNPHRPTVPIRPRGGGGGGQVQGAQALSPCSTLPRHGYHRLPIPGGNPAEQGDLQHGRRGGAGVSERASEGVSDANHRRREDVELPMADDIILC